MLVRLTESQLEEIAPMAAHLPVMHPDQME